MNCTIHGRVLATVIALPLLLTTVGCDPGKEQSKKRATATCGAEVSQTASTPLPADVPVIDGGTAYRYATQGKTRIWYVAVSGAAADLVNLRDKVKQTLVAKGYTIKGTDQEPGAEADADFSGPHEGTMQVRTLCSGKDVIRYRLES